MIARGTAARVQKAKRLEGGRLGIRGALANLSAGNSEFIKSSDLIFGQNSLAMRLLPRVTKDKRAKTEDLQKQVAGIENRQAAVAIGNSLSADVRGTQFSQIGGKIGQIDTDIAGAKADFARRNELSTRAFSGEALTDAELSELDDIQGRRGDNFDQAALDSFVADSEAKKAEYQQAQEVFSQSGVDIQEGQTIDSSIQQLEATADADSQRAQTVIGELFSAWKSCQCCRSRSSLRTTTSWKRIS